jgi:hypothetical protein
MRRILVLASTLLVALTTAASASAENPNTVTFTINCGAAGTFTGSQPGGAGGALLLESGGVAVAQGLAEVGGELLNKPTPGLEKQGKLVQCRFTFPGQPERIAFVFFAPPNR